MSDYKILQLLGQGGMGKVYKALDTKLHRTVAIKFFHESAIPNDKAIKRFMRESEISGNLDHPNIVKVFQFCVENGQSMLVMEYIEGWNLLEYVEQKKPSLEETLNIMRKVIQAVHYAHRKQIIHRDIKPSNIMVRTNGEPVLMDFGIAKASQIEDLTRTGEVLGSIQYMAPEQSSGIRHSIDHRADVYSLGAVLYHLLTQQPPILSKTFTEMLVELNTKEIRLPHETNPDIPADLEQICMKALCRDKEKRYPTARALEEDIQNYLAGQKIKAQGFLQTQKMRKRAWKLGIIFTCIFGIVAGGIGLQQVWSNYQQKNILEREEKERQQKYLETVAAIAKLVTNSHDAYDQGKIGLGYALLEDFVEEILRNPHIYRSDPELYRSELYTFLYETYSLSQIYHIAGITPEQNQCLISMDKVAKFLDISPKIFIENFWKMDEKNIRNNKKALQAIMELRKKVEAHYMQDNVDTLSKPYDTDVASETDKIPPKTGASFIQTILWPSMAVTDIQSRNYNRGNYQEAVKDFQTLQIFFQNLYSPKSYNSLQTLFQIFLKALLEYHIIICNFREKRVTEISNEIVEIESCENNRFDAFILEYRSESEKREYKISPPEISSYQKLYYGSRMYYFALSLAQVEFGSALPKEIEEKLYKIIPLIPSNLFPESMEEWALLQELKCRLLINTKADDLNFQKNLSIALDTINICLQSNPMRGSSYLIRGNIYFNLKKYYEAVEDFEYASQLSPEQIESLRKILEIFPEYQHPSYDSVEKVIGIVHRWWLQISMRSFHLWEDEAYRATDYLRSKWQEKDGWDISPQAREACFNRLFSFPRQMELAQSTLENLQPHAEIIRYLANKRKELETKYIGEELSQKLNIIDKTIARVRAKQHKKFAYQTLYLLSLIPFEMKIPDKIVAEFCKISDDSSSNRLEVLHSFVLEKEYRDIFHDAMYIDSEMGWQKLYYQAIRVLLQVRTPIANNLEGAGIFYRTWLYNRANSLDDTKKLLIMSAFQHIGYFDQAIMEHTIKFIENSANFNRKKPNLFIESIIARLLYYSRVVNTTGALTKFTAHCSDATMTWIMYFLPDFRWQMGDHYKVFMEAQEDIWNKGLDDSDPNRVFLSIICIKNLYGDIWESPTHSEKDKQDVTAKIWRKIEHFLSSKDTRLQAGTFALLANCGDLLKGKEIYIAKCAWEILNSKKIISPEFKMLLETLLVQLADKDIFAHVAKTETSFLEKIAFFYGLPKDLSEGRLLVYVSCFKNIFGKFKTNEKMEGKGILLAIFSHFYHFFRSVIPSHGKIFSNILDEMILYTLRKGSEDLQFWSFLAIIRIDSLPERVFHVVDECLDREDFARYRGGLLGLLFTNGLKQSYSPEFQKKIPRWNTLLQELLQDPEKNRQQILSIIWSYRQLLRNNRLNSVTESNTMALDNWLAIEESQEKYVDKLIMDPVMLQRLEKGLNVVIDLNKKISTLTMGHPSEIHAFMRSIYFLAKVYHYKKDDQQATKILEYEDLHIKNARLGYLWLQINKDSPRVQEWWNIWQNKSFQDSNEKAFFLRMKAFLNIQKNDYNAALKDLAEAYLLCPEYIPIQTDILDAYIATNQNTSAEAFVEPLILLSPYRTPLLWYRIRLAAKKNDVKTIHHTLRQFFGIEGEYPITIQDMENLNLEPKDEHGKFYYKIAVGNATRYNFYHAVYWLKHAYDAKMDIKAEEMKGDFAKHKKEMSVYPDFARIWENVCGK